MALRVLIVEDHEPFRAYLRSVIEQNLRFQIVAEVANGFEAVTKAKELFPDLVLLDIGLPGQSGLEVAKRLHELTPQVKLLFISQESSIDIIAEAFRLGANGYIHKPLAHRDLNRAIETILSGEKFLSRQFGAEELNSGLLIDELRVVSE